MKDEDKTYENEREHMIHVGKTVKTILSPITHVRNIVSAAMFDDRGPGDLTLQIEMLTKQKQLLQLKCKQAGVTIAELKRDNQLLSYDIATITDRLRAAGL